MLRSYIRKKYDLTLPDRLEDEVRYLSIRYSYEPWIVKLWLSQFDVDFAEELMAAGNKTPDVAIKLN